ncbi:hypothetical protein, partial [Bradyrhizobium sp.]|uniref:hypothetical protein n=1 Tax=Bradyrhizobium sp. TaxID=376 RepID=UPI003C3FDF55
LTRDRFSTIKSKPQLAAALQGTLETMQGGLQALEQRRDAVLGPNSGVDLSSDDTRAKIVRIQAAIDRLKRGDAPPSAAPDAAAQAPQSAQAPQTAAPPDRAAALAALKAEMQRRGILK